MYDVNYFIEKFEAIPESLWCEGKITDGDMHCAIGHCGGVMNKELEGESQALVSIIFNVLGYGIFQINDSITNQYPQPTPKQRILAALYDIRDKELSEANIKATMELINEIKVVEVF